MVSIFCALVISATACIIGTGQRQRLTPECAADRPAVRQVGGYQTFAAELPSSVVIKTVSESGQLVGQYYGAFAATANNGGDMVASFF